jgi:hypothetical protein
MATKSIPKADWGRFLAEFGRRHEGWLATVRVLDPRIGSQVEARDLPLEGAVLSPVDSGPISLHLGTAPDRHIEHEVPDPREVWVETSANGAERALEMVSAGGARTIVEFRVPALPEEVDGVTHR